MVKVIPVGKGIAGQVIAQGQPVTMCNLQTDTSGVARPDAKQTGVGRASPGQVIAQGKPVTMCNLQTDTSGVARPDAKQTGVGGALCVPIRDGDKIVGTLGIGTRNREYEYTPAETQARWKNWVAPSARM